MTPEQKNRVGALIADVAPDKTKAELLEATALVAAMAILAHHKRDGKGVRQEIDRENLFQLALMMEAIGVAVQS